MKLLFVSNECFACTENFIKQALAYCPDVELVFIEYNKEQKKYLAFKDNEQVGPESPVSTTPTLYLPEEDKVFVGKKSVVNKLKNYANKQRSATS